MAASLRFWPKRGHFACGTRCMHSKYHRDVNYTARIRIKAEALSFLRLWPLINCIDTGGCGRYGRRIRLIIALTLTIEGYHKDARLGRMLHFDNRIIARWREFTVRWRRRGRCTLCLIGRGIRLTTTHIPTTSIRAGHQHKEGGQRQKRGHIPHNGNHIHCRLR